MKPMNIFDLHCDTLMPVYIDGYNLNNWTGHINLQKLQQGGSMVQCFAIYIPTNRSAEYHNVHEGPYEYWQGCVNAFDKEMAANADLIAPAHCVADILANKNIYYVTIVDPAKTPKLHSADSAIVTVGVDLTNHKIYFHDCKGCKYRPD